MNHIAIDLGGRESQICVRAEDSKILDEKRIPTGNLKSFFAEQAKSRVIMETCAESFAVAGWAMEFGHEVRIVPGTLVRQLGVGARKTKTDRRDARALSEVSCRIDLPTVHIASRQSRETKSIMGMRDGLVQSRTMLVNSVRGWMRGKILRLRGGSLSTFGRRVRTVMSEASEEMPQHVERQLGTIDQLSTAIGEANKEIAKLVKANPVCRRLLTAPGVGVLVAARFVATLDQIERFDSAHQVQSYLGLAPGENSSSERKRITTITKAGSPEMRWLLIQAAWAALRCRPNDPASQWARQIRLRRGPFIAVVALARKMAGVLYAMWRDGTEYAPDRASDPSKILMAA